MDDRIVVGRDGHVATISLAAIGPGGEMTEVARFPNTPAAVRTQLGKLGAVSQLAVYYEAGPTGYPLYRQLEEMGVHCVVVAPSLTPSKPGDRVKTDRRDALKLATSACHGHLPPIAVPTPALEALRDLSRLREAAAVDLHRARQRLLKCLNRYGVVEPSGTRWTQRWGRWGATVTLPEPVASLALRELRAAVRERTAHLDRITTALAQEAARGPFAALTGALQALHGIGVITAVGILAEVGERTRFARPDQLFAYAGLVASEHSSGGRTWRGAITKTGNRHLRFLLGEAAWHTIAPVRPLTRAPATARERIAHTARTRLHRRFWRLVARGKPKAVAIVAIARELLGVIWAIARFVADTATDVPIARAA